MPVGNTGLRFMMATADPTMAVSSKAKAIKMKRLSSPGIGVSSGPAADQRSQAAPGSANKTAG
ncbi:hypothetical protein ACX0MV_04040 [Pseudomonas borbori]